MSLIPDAPPARGRDVMGVGVGERGGVGGGADGATGRNTEECLLHGEGPWGDSGGVSRFPLGFTALLP